MKKRTLLVPVLCLAVLPAGVEGGGSDRDDTAPWHHVLDWLRSERDRMSASLVSAHAALLARATAAGEKELVERLSPEPPRSRPVGYGILPEILDDEPAEPQTPRERTYSLEVLSDGYSGEFRDAAILAGRSIAEPDLPLEPAVSEFERLRGRMRNLEDQLDYHDNWQRAVVEYREYFARQNRIVQLVREMKQVEQDGGKDEQVRKLHEEVLERIASFVPAPGLVLDRRADGTQVLQINVWTDIEEEAFLRAFQEAAETGFSESAAARGLQFSIELQLRHVAPSELYPEGAPARGAAIDVSEHQDRFPDGRLILTTGAESTHAWQGRSVLLGSAPLSRNTLVHEFAHLLGFGDSYLRGFDGDTGGPFGAVIVEWTGLNNDLMGWPAGGDVSERMIMQLIEAYGGD